MVDWESGHPVLAGLDGLDAVEAVRAVQLQVPSWGATVLTAASRHVAYPFLVVGDVRGRRRACLAAELPPRLAASDTMPLVLLTLATLRWLAEPIADAPITLATGVPVRAAGRPFASATGVRAVGDPPVVLAERAGVHRARVPRRSRPAGARQPDERRRIGRRAAGRRSRMAGDGGGGHDDGERTGRPVVVVLRSRGRAARARGAGVGDGAGARAMIARWRRARRAAVLRAVAAVLLALVLAGVVGTARPARGRVLRRSSPSTSRRACGMRVSTPRPGCCPPSAARWDHTTSSGRSCSPARRASPRRPHRRRPRRRRSPQPPRSPGSIATRAISRRRSAWPRRSVPTDSSRRCC